MEKRQKKGKQRKEHSKIGEGQKKWHGWWWVANILFQVGSIQWLLGKCKDWRAAECSRKGCREFWLLCFWEDAATPTPLPVGHLFRAEVQQQSTGYPQLQWIQWNKESAIKTEVLCSTESSGKRVEGCILKGYLSFYLNQTWIVLIGLFWKCYSNKKY